MNIANEPNGTISKWDNFQVQDVFERCVKEAAAEYKKSSPEFDAETALKRL